MTANEFNTKYETWLKKGFYGLAIDVPQVVDFLDKVFKDLTLIPNFTYSQIKVKFGTTRFYSTIGSELTYIIEKETDSILNNLVNKTLP